MSIILTPKQLERFWSEIDKSSQECWLWTGSKTERGIPRFRTSKQDYSAARVSYELAYGAISRNYRVVRKCNSVGCVRPEHLGLEVDPKTKSLEERFWEKVDKSGECWLWKGKKTEREGKFFVNNTFWSAHRIAYYLSQGLSLQTELPYIHQSCGNRLCVNPEHLYLETDPRGRSPEQRFWEKVDKSGECWTWEGKRQKRSGGQSRHDYGIFFYQSRWVKAHRFAYELSAGQPIPEGTVVCHSCDNPLCVRFDHLFLGSQADNIADMDAKGRRRVGIGEKVCTAKLTADRVQEIRQRYARGEKLAHLGRCYGVAPQSIWAIVNRKTWKHID